MKISQKGIELIKQFEGCRLKAYTCPSGIWTIGWGHTKNVYQGMIITQEKADQLFLEDVVNYYPIGDFSQNKFDSLTSFCYNCGRGALNDVLNSSDVTYTMSLYINGSNGPLEGLKRRRKEEIELYNTSDEIINGYSYCENGKATVLVDVLNIRSSPSLSGIIQDVKYYKGEVIENYQRVFKNDGYYWIEYKRNNGQYGYVAARNIATGERFLKCE